jgi:DNA-binding beta-propeller fold protein YncE
LATLASLCALTGALLFSSAPALAARGHIFGSAFGQPGPGNGQLNEPSGVAINEATHNLYVVDKGNNRVEEFSSTGAYIGQFNGSGTLAGEGSAAPTGRFSAPEGIAVDNSGNPLADPSAGDVYVVDTGHNVIDKFSSTGSYIGQLTEASSGSAFRFLDGVAIDQNGTLWVDQSRRPDEIGFRDKEVDSFSDAVANEFLSEIEPQLGGSPGFAVDSQANLYVARDFGTENDRISVFKLTSTGSLINEEVDHEVSATAVAVDLSNNNLYLDGVNALSGGSAIGLFSSEGKLIERFGSGILKRGAGVAVDSSSAAVYVADSTAGTVDVFELEPYSPPVVVSESASGVSSTSATFAAQINPRGSSTEYRFEYGPSTSYGTSAPVPDGFIAAGFGAGGVGVSIHRADLLAHTTYHYRVVAHNELGTVQGADHTFTSQLAGGAPALPDGRAWELVSPPNKNGALIEPFEAFPAGADIQAAGDGSAITYPTAGPAGENPQGKQINSTVLSRRGPGGWSSADIDMPRRLVKEGESGNSLSRANLAEFGVFSPDLSLALAEPTGNATPLLSPQATERTLYLRDNANGSYLPLVTPADVPPGTKFGGEESFIITPGSAHPVGGLVMRFVAATPDLSHVVFKSPLALTPPAVSLMYPECEGLCGPANLYEWAAGRLQLVNILPGGEPTHGPPVEQEGEGAKVAGEGAEFGLAARPISADGRWVAWTWSSRYGSLAQNFKGLYVRDMVAKKTFQVGGPLALYQTMSSDGSRLFFLENGELYEFDTGTGTQVALTAHHGVAEAGAGVREAVSDVSADGSHVYFVATGVLADGALSGADNLYLLHDNGGEWTTTFIATLSHEDEPSWYTEETGGSPNLAGVSSRVTPDGRYLAFMSNRSLTGYDNLDANSGQPDEEVYLYDAATGRLVCASCNPTGARPVGVLDAAGITHLLVDPNEFWGKNTARIGLGTHWLAGSIPGWTDRSNAQSLYQPRYLSDSGRLFFNSADALVPQDTNGLEDVYEYEPPGVGGCTSADMTFSERSGGCVNLISSGTSSSESVFYDASESGNDVFFLTASRLTAADYDKLGDVYDAHVCSASLPCLAAPVSPPPCSSGDSCKPAPAPQPELFGPAPSATFSGAGNVPPAPPVAAKPLTRAQKLSKALGSCRKRYRHAKKRRASCERTAHKHYGYAAGRAHRANTTKRGGK